MVDATMQPLALLDGRFYSMGVSSPILTIGSTLSGPIFHMVDATRYATLRASDPNPCPTLAIVFFVVTPPPLGPGWR
jgi:ABC-2 type transport system permease protein